MAEGRREWTIWACPECGGQLGLESEFGHHHRGRWVDAIKVRVAEVGVLCPCPDCECEAGHRPEVGVSPEEEPASQFGLMTPPVAGGLSVEEIEALLEVSDFVAAREDTNWDAVESARAKLRAWLGQQNDV